MLLWEVGGGRMLYQVALERQENDQMTWHCTCADATYRGSFTNHQCKHVQALRRINRTAFPTAS